MALLDSFEDNPLPFLFCVLPWLLALPACHGAASPPPAAPPAPSAVESVPSAAAQDADRDAATPDEREDANGASDATLRRLSQGWAKDPELTYSEPHPSDDLARCPRAAHDPRPETRAMVPTTFVRVEALATHACDAVLWVFLGCTSADSDEVESCSVQSWSERLVLEPVGGGAASDLGHIEPLLGANAGGLHVPFAFARGDRRILLDAWMFSPGAGGGAVRFGVGLVATSTRAGKDPIPVEPLAARDAAFTSGFGCAIGLAASDATPTYTQPGHPADNGGALVMVNLSTLRSRTLLAQTDTTYSVQKLDEKTRTLQIEVTRHTFGKDCPRGEGALDCSTTRTTRSKLPLPACAP